MTRGLESGMRTLVWVALIGCAAGDRASPTATLTANDAATLDAHAGDTITYAWSSENGDTGTSAVMMSPGPDACGNHDGPWVIDDLAGMTDPAPILACQVGTTYALTFTVAQSDSDQTATAAITIVVN